MTPFDRSLAFHAAAPGGTEGYVLLVEAGSAPGRVLVRRWRSPDYTAEVPPLEQEAADLRDSVVREARAGWRFTLPPERVLAWLEDSGS